MKRLIVCADGTWNLRDQLDKTTGKRRPTNVTKVARAIVPRDARSIDQIVFYHDGLGTGGPLDRVSGGAFGTGIEENIRALYRFVVYNWSPGDEIYMFGFSRGAFTVRSLAGFMHTVGLVDKDDDFWVPELYGCYEANKRPGTPEWDRVFRRLTNVRPCPPIKFIGVWDTVGSLGAPGLLGWLFNSRKYKYHRVDLTSSIENAYHALAIDERRKPFAPTLWELPAGWSGNLEQVWFAGVHTNVGGSYTPDGLANEALHWMVEKAERIGLEIDASYLQHYRPCFNAELGDSMTIKYRALGQHVRALGAESVHQSVLDRHHMSALKYAPENLKALLSRTTPTVVNTTRIARGVPCP